MKNRIFYYDFLRTLAILFVILCHTSHFFSWGGTTLTSRLISYTLYDLAKLGVPIFFMLSGALLLNKDYELGYFLKRRFTRIFYPFLFWIFIILIGVYYITGTQYLLDMFLGTNGQFSWFVWTLMGMYLFVPIFNTFIKRYGIKAVEYYLIFWIFTIILSQFNSYPFGRFDLTLFSGWFGVLVLGYYLDNKDFKISDSKLCIIGFVIFLICLIINVYWNYTNYVPCFSIDQCGYLSLLSIVISSGFFLFIRYFNKINSIKDNFIGKAITSISICSYGMYFTHIIIVRPFLLFLNHNQPLYITAVIYIFVCVTSWMVIYIFSRIPYLNKVCGT